jgi:quercetin dioxygenase-like cupin family protein
MPRLSRRRRDLLGAGWILVACAAANASCEHAAPAVAVTAAQPPPAAVVPSTEPPGGGAPAAPRAEVTRKLVASANVPGAPGFESRVYRIEYPPGAQANPHVHTEQDFGYVVEGRFEAEFGDDPVIAGQTGDGFVEVAHQPHRFRNADPARPLVFVTAGTYRKDEAIFTPLAGSPAFVSKDVARSLGPAAATAGEASGAPPREIVRRLLAQRDVPDIPGMELRLYLMEFPPGAESKVHVHLTPGVGYVVEGSFESSFGTDPVTVKRAGDGFVDMPGAPHHFRNADSARPLRFVFAGTFHKDEPLFQVLPQ